MGWPDCTPKQGDVQKTRSPLPWYNERQKCFADRAPSPPAPLPHGERGDSAVGRIRLPLSRSGRGGWGLSGGGLLNS